MDMVRAQKGQIPYRCRDCRIRFYSASSAEPPVAERQHRHRRGIRAIWKRRKRPLVNVAIFLMVLGLFVICLNYLANDHPDRRSSRVFVCESQKIS
jgi:hypothetical protein